MKEELDIAEKLDLTIDLESPEDVVSNIAKQIKEITSGYVDCIVGKYDDPIDVVEPQNFVSSMASIFSDKRKYKVQLGPVGYEYSNYQLYLTATSLPRYQFSIMFFRYGIGRYPVDIVIEETIASSLEIPSSTMVESKDELERVVRAVLTADQTIKIMQGLINASRIYDFEKTNATA